MTDSKYVVLFLRYQTVGSCQPAEAGGGAAGADGPREAQSGGRTGSLVKDDLIGHCRSVVIVHVCVSGQVQESFADTALDIKRMYTTGDRGKVMMSWTAASLSDVISVLLAAQRRQDAW